MKKGKSILSLILVIAVTALFGMTCVLGLDLKGMGAAKNINLGLDLEGGVAQDLLDLPAIQAGSDDMSVNFDPPLLICGGVEEGFFNHGFGRSSFRIRMLFPSALMLYKSSRWMWNPSSRTVSAIPKAAFANRSSPARFPVNSNSFPSA